jgi:hypothetical protein
MSHTTPLAGIRPALLFLKATRRERRFIPQYTRKNGEVVQGHYADVIVASDHDDTRVLAGNGSHYQQQAHARLVNQDWFHALPHEHRVNVLLHVATRRQAEASHSAAISQWRAAALNGRNPSPAQWRAFYAVSNERKAELLREVERTGNTSHLDAPPMPASEAAIARAAAAERTDSAPSHPVPRPSETLGSVGLSARTVEKDGHLVLADDSGAPRVFYHGGPATLGGGRLHAGSFFAINRADALGYARQHDGGQVHEANLSLLKPASTTDIVAAARAVGVDFSRVEGMDPAHPEQSAWSLVTDGHTHDAPRVVAKLKEWGFDGAAFDNDFEVSGNRQINSVMAFSGDQIVPVVATPAMPRVVAASMLSPNAGRVASAIQGRALERLASLPARHGEVDVSRIFQQSREVGPTNAPAPNQWVEQDVDLSQLHPMQDEVEASAVRQYVEGAGRTPNSPIKVIRDEAGSLLLMDGHHRASAAILEGRTTIPALVATMTGVGEDADGMAIALYATPSPAQPAAAAAADAGGPRTGDTKTVDGVAYVLRDGRWHRQSEEAPAGAAPSAPPADAPAPTPSGASHEQRSAAMRVVPAPTFHATSESNAGCTRRVAQLQAFAAVGDVDSISNFATSRTRTNYARVADYRDALLAAAQNLTPAQAQAAVSAQIPAAPTLTGANMQNTALLAAQRKINMLRDAAIAANPVAAIQAISTSRGNRYLNAADDYKRALLAHFGVNIAGEAVPAVSAEGPTTSTPRRVIAAREAPAPAAPMPAAGTAEFQRYENRSYRRVPGGAWQFEEYAGGPWHDVRDATMRSRLDRGVDPIIGGGTRAAANGAAGRTPVPDSQNPAIAANPLGLSEAVLGFVPRPNVPLSVRTNQSGVQWPDPRMADLNRRYLAQSTALQQRAREYQAGTYRPPTPEQAAAEAAAAAERQRAEQQAIRRAAAELEARLGNIDAMFRPRSRVGANVSSMSFHNSDAEVRQVLGVTKAQADTLFRTMIADYGAGVSFSVSASISGREASVHYTGSDGTTITRRFTNGQNGLTVYHAYFKAGRTGGGSGKHLFRCSMGVYKALGVTEVGVSANIDVGGYAWARFGYLPRDWGGLRRTIGARLDGLVRSGRPPSEATVQKVRRLLESDSPETLWAIADMRSGERQLGKELLLNTSWGGVMRMSHKPTMLRFAQYVKPEREA